MEYIIPEMGDTSIAPAELQGFELPHDWMSPGMAVPENEYDILAEYMRPQWGRHDAY